jgi:hypothetical protein
VDAYQSGELLDVRLLHYWRELVLAALQPNIATMNRRFQIAGMWEGYAAEALTAAAARLLERKREKLDLAITDVARVMSQITWPLCEVKDVEWIATNLIESQKHDSEYMRDVSERQRPESSRMAWW